MAVAGENPDSFFLANMEDEKVDRGSGRRRPPVRAQAERLRAAAHRLKTLRLCRPAECVWGSVGASPAA